MVITIIGILVAAAIAAEISHKRFTEAYNALIKDGVDLVSYRDQR